MDWYDNVAVWDDLYHSIAGTFKFYVNCRLEELKYYLHLVENFT